MVKIMKTKFMIILVCMIVFPFSTEIIAKEWKGIIPLQSTRKDVTRILGRSSDANKLRANYDVEEGHIYIVFSNKEDFVGRCAEKLPIDTVLYIQFRPNKEFSLSEFDFDLNNFRKFDPSEPKGIGYEGFVDEDKGLIIRTYKDKIDEIIYMPNSNDRKFCKDFYDKPESFIRVVVCGLQLN